MKVLKFYADWCQPCKMLSGSFEDAELGGKELVEIDIDTDDGQEQARQFGVRGIPTVVIVDDAGVEVKRTSGYLNTKDLNEFLK